MIAIDVAEVVDVLVLSTLGRCPDVSDGRQGGPGNRLWKVGDDDRQQVSCGPGDMFLRGTALTPPLFLPVLLLVGAAAAREDGTRGRVGAGIVSLVGVAFLAGSAANLPKDFAAAKSAGTPLGLTAGLVAVHLALSIALLVNAVPRLRGRDQEALQTARGLPAL